MISAVILTLNEERNIVECIETLQPWCNDVVVYDSFSTDRTVELAKSAGARVFQRKFDNYAAQRNAALHEVDYPNDWVVMVDADERFDDKIGQIMTDAVGNPNYQDVQIFHLQRKDIFLGQWLKHGIGSGTWFGRLLKHQFVTVERDINEEYHCKGRKEYLTGERFLHYPFNNGVNWWISRHNRYSDMEAVRLSAEKAEKLQFKKLFSKDPAERRKHQKQLLYRLPGRPLLMFFVLYFLKLGFLDGKAGFHYAVLRSFYEYMIDLKIVESK
ncbi:MAG: glycosyltransferase family 2 protein [Lentisphaerae bacterium]|nr:glycosyltransferase family 2 protein [Lentisphaerota bacterium]